MIIVIVAPEQRSACILTTFDGRSELVGIKHSATEPDPLLGYNGRFAHQHSYQPDRDKQHWCQDDEHNSGNNDVKDSFARSAKRDIRIGAPRARWRFQFPNMIMH